MTNAEIFAVFERLWQHVVLKVSTKADSEHTHDDLQALIEGKADSTHDHDDSYYTESEIDTKMIEVKEYADAQIQNVTVTSEDVIHNGSKLSDTLDTQSDKMDLIISSTSSGQTSTISIHTEDMNDWILQEGYWEGSYISTGV